MRGWHWAVLTMPIILATLYQTRIALFRAWSSSSRLSQLAWKTTMSTFQHPDYNIPITLPAGLTQDQVLNFHPFTVSSHLPSPLPAFPAVSLLTEPAPRSPGSPPYKPPSRPSAPPPPTPSTRTPTPCAASPSNPTTSSAPAPEATTLLLPGSASSSSPRTSPTPRASPSRAPSSCAGRPSPCWSCSSRKTTCRRRRQQHKRAGAGRRNDTCC